MAYKTQPISNITESELKKHIKLKEFSPIYVIYGDEQLYVKKYTELLVDAVAGNNPSEFNFHSFEGEFELDDFAASLQIIPFLSKYNCVLATDIYFDQANADWLDRFKEITSKVCEGTILIISMPTYVPDKNKSAFDSLLKRAQKLGSVCNFGKLNQSAVEKYIAKWANENGKKISKINAAKLISYCGDDLNLLKNEVDKISALAKDDEISLADIEHLATVNIESKIFALSDAVLSNNGQTAFNILDRLFYQQEEAGKILNILEGAYVDAYRIRVADESGVSLGEVAADFEYKNKKFKLEKGRRVSSKVSTEALRSSLDTIISTETDFKTSSINSRLCLEQLISQLLLIAKEGRV